MKNSGGKISKVKHYSKTIIEDSYNKRLKLFSFIITVLHIDKYNRK